MRGRRSPTRFVEQSTADEHSSATARGVLPTAQDFSVSATDPRPLIAHVVYRFDIGGLENGVVNLLNRLPRDRFRHAVIALTEVTRFRERVARDDVAFIELRKAPGHAISLFPRLLRTFRHLRPTIVHTRNLAALEASIPARLAGVPIRIHGEHGRDIGDLDGSNRKYRFVRRVYRPFVTHYVALSRDLERYLHDAVGVPEGRVTAIVNGVDADAFTPGKARPLPGGLPFAGTDLCICGSVGRLQPVKNHIALAQAFVHALELEPSMRGRLRLVIVGEGPLSNDIIEVLRAANVLDLAWLPGARNDVAEILGSLDVFVLPSLAEGISNTILEAMASGLPVIATDVGGNGELVEDGSTGMLVPGDDVPALARAMLVYATDRELARSNGRSGRISVERLYGLDGMVARYCALYEWLIARNAGVTVTEAPSAEAPATTESH
jgi:sugar transferase (PEP-CTERM/EpsH1 system associated)